MRDGSYGGMYFYTCTTLYCILVWTYRLWAESVHHRSRMIDHMIVPIIAMHRLYTYLYKHVRSAYKGCALEVAEFRSEAYWMCTGIRP